MSKGRSKATIVYSAIDVKAWMERIPGVDEVRPGQCPQCQGASRPVGRSLGIWGHGLRWRQQRGPLTAEGKPEEIALPVRRYRCRPCRAVLVVVPRGVIAGRLFSAAAIGLAMALLAIRGLSMRAVRSRVSPWRHVGKTAAVSWLSLRRWIAAVRDGRLLGCVRRAPTHFTARQVAERAAQTLSALAPLEISEDQIEARVFAGAALAG